MIKISYLDLRMRSQCLVLKSVFSFYKIKKNNFRIFMQMDSKSISEDILQLTSPLIIINLQTRSQSSLLSSLQTDVHQGLLSLSLKPSLKIDKKVKKKGYLNSLFYHPNFGLETNTNTALDACVF